MVQPAPQSHPAISFRAVSRPPRSRSDGTSRRSSGTSSSTRCARTWSGSRRSIAGPAIARPPESRRLMVDRRGCGARVVRRFERGRTGGLSPVRVDRIGCEDALWQRLIHGIYLGTEDWAAKHMRARVESKPRSTNRPKTQRSIGRPKMHQIIAAVAKFAECTAEISAPGVGTRSGRSCLVGWHEGWLTLRSIAAALRLRSEGHISTSDSKVRADVRLTTRVPRLSRRGVGARAVVAQAHEPANVVRASPAITSGGSCDAQFAITFEIGTCADSQGRSAERRERKQMIVRPSQLFAFTFPKSKAGV